MKRITSILPLLTLLLVGLVGCTPEFSEPPVKEYTYTGKATHTIAQFKQLYANTSLAKITSDIILKGVINASDSSGNVYKKIYLQDETGGLEISVDAASNYNTYSVGQEVFVECKDLYIGLYGGVLQLGMPYVDKTGKDAIGRMPKSIAYQHIFSNGKPDKSKVKPIVVSSLAELNDGMLDRLVTINGIFFTSGGIETFALKPTKDNSYPTEREFTDSKGIKGITYTSGYARFSQDILPKGLGSITCIVTAYNGKWQLIIRDREDIGTFDGSVIEPPKPPVYTGNATHTIAQFKTQFGNTDLAEITENVVIKGIVSSSDQSGNIFKKIYIQDETGAISIGIAIKELYKTYKPGQEIFIECKGLHVGKYGGVLQVGQKFLNTKTNIWQIGQMSEAEAITHIFKKQDPGALVSPTITDIASITPDMLDKLVTIKNVTFTNGGTNVYAIKNTNNAPTMEELKDAQNNVISIATSAYASFAATTLPTGPVTITAILSQYNGTWQLIIVDLKDVVK